jgi:hypothetical protein
VDEGAIDGRRRREAGMGRRGGYRRLALWRHGPRWRVAQVADADWSWRSSAVGREDKKKKTDRGKKRKVMTSGSHVYVSSTSAKPPYKTTRW